MKFLAGTILTLFLGLMFISLFHMSGTMNMSHGLNDTGGCPFMLDQEVVCTMNLSEHLSSWKVLFFSLIPPVFTIFLVLGVVVLIALTAPHLLSKHQLHLLTAHWYHPPPTTYSYIIRPYQELFSSGILHPKLF